MIKTITRVLLILLVVFAALYYYGTGSNLKSKDYFTIKKYNPVVTIESDTLSERTFTVMTFNIGYLSGMTNNTSAETSYSFYRKNLDKAIEVIGNLHPNVIGFQEIDFASSRSYFQQQLDSIAIRNEYAEAYQSVNWDKRYVPFPYIPISSHFGKIISGQAILSDFELVDYKTITLDKPENNPFYYNAFYIDRLIQISTCRIGDRELKILNVHLEAFDRASRISQSKRVRKVYEQHASEMPVLMIGDFNSELPHESEIVSGGIREILKAENIASAISAEEYNKDKKSFYTYSSGDPSKMIDFIFYNPSHIRKIDARVVNEMGEVSDHLPKWMSFTFTQ